VTGPGERPQPSYRTYLAAYERAWQRYQDRPTEPHYLTVFIQRLRRKLGDDPAEPHYIETQRGFGYRFLRPS